MSEVHHCRMCGEMTESGVPLLDPANHDLLKCVVDNFSYMIHPLNGYPNHVCPKCVKKLHIEPNTKVDVNTLPVVTLHSDNSEIKTDVEQDDTQIENAKSVKRNRDNYILRQSKTVDQQTEQSDTMLENSDSCDMRNVPVVTLDCSDTEVKTELPNKVITMEDNEIPSVPPNPMTETQTEQLEEFYYIKYETIDIDVGSLPVVILDNSSIQVNTELPNIIIENEDTETRSVPALLPNTIRDTETEQPEELYYIKLEAVDSDVRSLPVVTLECSDTEVKTEVDTELPNNIIENEDTETTSVPPLPPNTIRDTETEQPEKLHYIKLEAFDSDVRSLPVVTVDCSDTEVKTEVITELPNNIIKIEDTEMTSVLATPTNPIRDTQHSVDLKVENEDHEMKSSLPDNTEVKMERQTDTTQTTGLQVLPEVYIQCELCEWRMTDTHLYQQHLGCDHHMSREEIKKFVPEPCCCEYCKDKRMTYNFFNKVKPLNKIEPTNSDSDMIESSPQIYNCKYCSLKFEENSLLTQHVQSKHFENIVGENACLVPSVFDTQTQIKTQSFICEFCNKTFRQKINLKNHIIKFHMQPNNSEYPKSKIAPISPINISQKMKYQIHTCDICGVSFFKKSHVKKHIIILHIDNNYTTFSNELPSNHIEPENQKLISKCFTCDICDSNFFKKSHLKKHIIVLHLDNDYTTSIKLDIIQTEPEINTKKSTFYACAFCYKTFVNKLHLKHHINKVHLKTKKKINIKTDVKFKCKIKRVTNIKNAIGDKVNVQFKCDKCNKFYKNHKSLYQHKSFVHVEAKYTCYQCGKRLKSKRSLILHIKACHNSDDKLDCIECGLNFTSTTALKKHNTSNHVDKQIKCNQCGKCFTNNILLKKHKSNVHLEVKHACSQCDKKFKLKYHLVRHIKACHNTDDKLDCIECGLNFTSTTALKCHNTNIHTDRHIKCNQCGKCFTTNKLLKLHNSMVHVEAKHACSQCDKAYKQKSDLVRHIKSCHNSDDTDDKLDCVECGLNFTSTLALKYHYTRIHVDKQIKCNQCAKCFTTNILLKQHKSKVHVETKFACSQCYKKFKINYNLVRHIKACHNGDDKLDCIECGLNFTSTTALKYHNTSNHVDKQIKCNQCEKCFKTKHNLQIHKSRVHVEAKYACYQCGKKFKMKPHLSRHIKICQNRDDKTN